MSTPLALLCSGCSPVAGGPATSASEPVEIERVLNPWPLALYAKLLPSAAQDGKTPLVVAVWTVPPAPGRYEMPVVDPAAVLPPARQLEGSHSMERNSVVPAAVAVVSSVCAAVPKGTERLQSATVLSAAVFSKATAVPSLFQRGKRLVPVVSWLKASTALGAPATPGVL